MHLLNSWTIMKKLVILSVPFQRINRVLLSPIVLNVIRQECKLIIVSPFATHPDFIAEYSDENTTIMLCPPLNKQVKLVSMLYEVSEILRMNGHWRKFRKTGTNYHYEISKVKVGRNGADTKYSFAYRTIFKILSLIGSHSKSWKALDSLLSGTIYKFDELLNLANDFEDVTLIQSASWGDQDRMLANLADRSSWRNVILPYTTDQLYCNGYLLANYDSVCVQGEKEDYFAKHFHGIDKKNIVKLGSVWFRHIDILKNQIPRIPITAQKTICYAGCSNLYFPTVSEFAGLDFLINAIENHQLKNVNLVYRPLVESEEDRIKIFERYGNISFLNIQIAQKACYSLDEMDSQSQEEQLMEYLGQSIGSDLLIMAYATTLSIDLAYLGVPSIANFVDPTGTLTKRHSHLRLNDTGRIEGIEAIPVANSYSELLALAQKLLDDPIAGKIQTEFTVRQWDYPAQDFKNKLSWVLKRRKNDTREQMV